MQIDFLDFFHADFTYLTFIVSFLKNHYEKWLVFSSYNLIIKLSESEKLQKYGIALSQHTYYLHKWLAYLNFDIFAAAIFIFFLRDS